MSHSDVVIVLNTEHIAGMPDPALDDLTFTVLNWKLMGLLGMSPKHVKMLPSNWHEFPGVLRAIKGLDGGDSQPRFLQSEIRTHLSTSQKPIEGAAAEVLAPLYTLAFQNEGLHEPTFIIGTHLNVNESLSIQGLRLKYLLNALAGTIGAKRRMVEPFPAPSTQMPRWSRELLELCVEANRNPDGFQQGDLDARILRISEEVEVLDQIANAVDLPESVLKVWWNGGRNDVAFAPTQNWQTIIVAINEPAGTDVFVQLYDSPALITLRRCVWIYGDRTTDVSLTAHQMSMARDDDETRLAGIGYLSMTIPHGGVRALQVEMWIDASDRALYEVISSARGSMRLRRQR